MSLESIFLNWSFRVSSFPGVKAGEGYILNARVINVASNKDVDANISFLNISISL